MQKSAKSRPNRIFNKRRIKDLYTASPRAVVKMLLADGFLQNKEGQLCPFCGDGVLSKLVGSHHRCTKKGCQYYILPHHTHPIFSTGRGQCTSTLEDQAVVLMYAVHNASQALVHSITGHNHKMIEAIYKNLDIARRDFVEREEKKIQFGKDVR